MTGPLSRADRANLITDQGEMEGGGGEMGGGEGGGEGSGSVHGTLVCLSILDMKY